MAAGALTDVVWCLSREPGAPKMYVQDGIAANRDAIANILRHPAAHYYVCGAADMASTVAGAVQKVLGAELTTLMQSEGRWHEDIFAAKKAESKTAAEVSHDRDSKLTAMQDDTKANAIIEVRRPPGFLCSALPLEPINLVALWQCMKARKEEAWMQLRAWCAGDP